MTDLADAVFAAAERRDLTGAVTLVRDHMVRGDPVEQVLAALGGVQRRVGERWYQDRWSVADEHAATAIVDAALAAVEGAVGPASPDERTLSVVVACPETEWHALPARMLATALRARGSDVVFLGASMPADHLARYAEAHRPDLVALSVSTALGFGATARAIDAVHGVGVRVVLGGRALGGSDRRARALGADAWSGDAAGVLATSPVPVPTEVAVTRRQERELVVLGLELHRPALVDAAMGVLASRIPVVGRFDHRQLAPTREDLEHIVRFVEASVLVDDPTVFAEFVAWLGPLLTARGVPDGAVRASLAVLHEVSTDETLRGVLAGVPN